MSKASAKAKALSVRSPVLATHLHSETKLRGVTQARRASSPSVSRMRIDSQVSAHREGAEGLFLPLFER